MLRLKTRLKGGERLDGKTIKIRSGLGSFQYAFISKRCGILKSMVQSEEPEIVLKNKLTEVICSDNRTRQSVDVGMSNETQCVVNCKLSDTSIFNIPVERVMRRDMAEVRLGGWVSAGGG